VSIHLPVGSCGDCIDRLLLRVVEIISSSFIGTQLMLTSSSGSCMLAVDSTCGSDSASASLEGSLSSYKSTLQSSSSSSVLSNSCSSTVGTEVPKGVMLVVVVSSNSS
jgi:NADH:ubiquinone oxidoreductase subunit D